MLFPKITKNIRVAPALDIGITTDLRRLQVHGLSSANYHILNYITVLNK